MLFDATPVHQHSPADVKIRLFRTLFRGRDDVYPRRFESRKTGRSGYSPACGNEWVRGICEKPRVKCADCQFRHFLPVTDDVIRWHLSGIDPAGEPFVAGVYPMLQDETCFFLAVDFDKDGWQEAALAFLEGCRTLSVSAVLERSRSGRGGHIWLFFEEAITAVSARRLGSFILTETMERHSGISFASYDRFFPNQDTLPHGGFGNLIALPLQKQPRDLGNSVFVDDNIVPYADQWAFLQSVTKIPRVQVEDLGREAERSERVFGVRLPQIEEEDFAPWTAPPSRSAVPGWPADVLLPSDPEWKRDYAATVRRLIRDGVDMPLASLFVRAIKPSSPEQTGVAGARSASEAFLYRRLETLPETRGHFQLNVCVPIAFDGRSEMEVDFVSQRLRLVIELDGEHHLSNAEAYRRDRRKDRLLQQNGYFILRFLAVDLGKDLDAVLDSIVQALAGR